MNRIMIAGTHSGCGKTTVVCGVLQALVNRKLKVSAFKCGSDYIDPMFHSKIIGAGSRNLDSFFCDKNTLNYLIERNSRDISVIEGVMGFYDGVKDDFSPWRIAVDTGTPVVMVIDCKGMSMSIGALMKGFLSFRDGTNIIGFIFNRLPESLVNMAEELCREMGVEYFGRLPFCRSVMIESRHLGLVTADEIDKIKDKMQQLSRLTEENINLDKLLLYAGKAIDVPYEGPKLSHMDYEKKPVIYAAYDEAFCFYYEDNFDILRELGCEICFFSPLRDKKLPDNCSGLILGGGYPELYAKQLSENTDMLENIRNHINGGLPTIAECGGFMYLHNRIDDYAMVGVINGCAFKTEKLQRFGYINMTAKQDNLLCKSGDKLKAHEFHYWDSTQCGKGYSAEKVSNGIAYDCVNSSETLYAGFPHLHFYANPNAAERFVRKCISYSNK